MVSPTLFVFPRGRPMVSSTGFVRFPCGRPMVSPTRTPRGYGKRTLLQTIRVVALATTLFGSQILFVEVETLIELVDTSCRVNQLLLTSEERMALGADFHADVLSCRGCFNYLSAVAFNCCGLIIGMYSGFHQNHLHTRLGIYLL